MSCLLSFALLAACQGGAASESEPVLDPPPPELSLGDVVEGGAVSLRTTDRPSYGVLRLRVAGTRTVTLETTRDAAETPSRRLVVREGERLLWTRAEGPAEHFSDFSLHPSGDVTLAVERRDAERRAYDLLRLSADGAVRARTALSQGESVPEAERPDLPYPPFRMSSRDVDALTDGWLRVESLAEDVVVAFETRIDSQAGDVSPDLASGVMSLAWSGSAYAERWAHVVEGRHRANPPVWAYDELRARDAVVRPLLAVDEGGRAVVGRTWTVSRCRAVAATFGEYTTLECRRDAGPGDAERQPFAFTTFTPTGTREGTRWFIPEHYDEFVVFDMAVRGDDVAIVGSAVQPGPDGASPRYPPAPGAEPTMIAYDGYLAVLDRKSGAPRFSRLVDTGRGDQLAAVRFAGDGLVAVGAADWDRWYGGMSISHGADPLLAYVSLDGRDLRVRRLPLTPDDRHFQLLAVDVAGDRIVAAGLADAPMTHSGDGDVANRTFGGLFVSLTR